MSKKSPQEEEILYNSLPKSMLIDEILNLKARVEVLEASKDGKIRGETGNERLLRMFGEISELILDSLDSREIFDRLARSIVEAGLFRSLMVAVVQEERHQVEVVANYVCVKNLPGQPRFTPPGTSITSVPNVTIYDSGDVQSNHEKIIGLTYDLDDDNITPTVARSGELKVLGSWDKRVKSKRDYSYFIPVKRGEKVVAVLATGSNPDQKEQMLHTIELMQPLLNQVAIGIEHARLYQELGRERERLSTTLGSIGEGVIALDAEGRVLLLNQAAEKMAAFKHETAVGKSLERALPWCGAEVSKLVADVLDGAHKQENEVLEVRKDASQFNISCVQIPSEDGGCSGAVLVIHDITLQRKLETEIARAERLESLGILAGGIAHDFNNILGSVLLNVSLLQMRGLKNQSDGTLLEEIERALVQARELTQQLVTFSRESEPTVVASSLEELICESTIFTLRGTGVEPRFECDASLWPAEIDTTQFTQVVQNLVLNAAQAMNNEGRLTITLLNSHIGPRHPSPLKAGRYIECRFTDEGCGIPLEDIDRIFDPYFTRRGSEGTGLGLTSAYTIMARHRGWLMVNSAVGIGTTFTVYVPASETQVVVKQPKPGAEAEQFSGRILIMDDDDTLVRAASQALKTSGFEVEGVPKGEDALQAYRRGLEEGNPIHLVILDLTVPGGMGGKETACVFKEQHPEVPLLASTGLVMSPSMDELRSWGFTDIINKPYTFAEFIKRIKEVLRA